MITSVEFDNYIIAVDYHPTKHNRFVFMLYDKNKPMVIDSLGNLVIVSSLIKESTKIYNILRLIKYNPFKKNPSINDWIIYKDKHLCKLLGFRDGNFHLLDYSYKIIIADPGSCLVFK